MLTPASMIDAGVSVSVDAPMTKVTIACASKVTLFALRIGAPPATSVIDGAGVVGAIAADLLRIAPPMVFVSIEPTLTPRPRGDETLSAPMVSLRCRP